MFILTCFPPGHQADRALQAGEASRLQADLQDHEETTGRFPELRLPHTLLQHHAPRTAAPRPGRVCNEGDTSINVELFLAKNL